ncbi:MAG: cation:proton antiporter [Victivallales bacterium]
MKKLIKLLFYILAIGGFVLFVYWISGKGKILELENLSIAVSPIGRLAQAKEPHILQNLLNNIRHPLAKLVLQIITILVAARLFGMLFLKIGQPMVIGEIVAGIALGPSLLGCLCPSASIFLFPLESLPNLQLLSQIGLILFMFVLMALVTTFMTGPALSLIGRIFPEITVKQIASRIVETGNKILISFGPALTGVRLLRLAGEISPKSEHQANITALHLTLGTDMHPIHADSYAQESFQPLLDEAKASGVKIETCYKVTDDIEQEILGIAESQNYDLILIGSGKSIYKGSLLGSMIGMMNILSFKNILQVIKGKPPIIKKDDLIHEKARHLIENAPCTVGVFIDKDFKNVGSIFIPVLNKNDAFVLTFIKKFIKNSGSAIEIFDKEGILANNPAVISEINSMNDRKPNTIRFIGSSEIEQNTFFEKHQLILVSYDGWETLVKNHKDWIKKMPSALIIKPGREFMPVSA